MLQMRRGNSWYNLGRTAEIYVMQEWVINNVGRVIYSVINIIEEQANMQICYIYWY